MHDRFKANSGINKILRSEFSQQLNSHERQSTGDINNYSLSRNVKNDLKELVKRLSGWKAYDLYNRKINAAEEKINSLEGDLRKELAGALSGIKGAESLKDFKGAAEKIQGLTDKKDLKAEGAIKGIKDISDLKLSMLLSDKEEQLKRQIEDSGLFEYDAQKLKESLDELRTAGDNELAEDSLKLKEAAMESGLKNTDGINDFIKAKAYSSVRKKKERIEKLLDESSSGEARKKISENFNRLQSEEDPVKFDSAAEAMKENIKGLSSRGFIPESSRDILLKETAEFSNLIQPQIGTAEKKDKFEYRQEWEELLDSPSLKNETSRLLKELTNELSKTNTLAEFKNMQEEITREIAPLTQEFKNAFNEFAEIKRMFIMEKALLGLREKIAEIEKIDAAGAEILEQDLRKMRGSRSSADLEKDIEKIKEDIETGKLKKAMKDGISDNRSLRLNVIPPRVVMPIGTSVPLKIFAVYNDVFLKELGFGLECSSSRPDVARIDEKGIVYSAAAGRTDIHVRYKEAEKNIEVTVVDGIDEKTGAEIKQDLIK
jgi:hypothetical protein